MNNTYNGFLIHTRDYKETSSLNLTLEIEMYQKIILQEHNSRWPGHVIA